MLLLLEKMKKYKKQGAELCGSIDQAMRRCSSSFFPQSAGPRQFLLPAALCHLFDGATSNFMPCLAGLVKIASGKIHELCIYRV